MLNGLCSTTLSGFGAFAGIFGFFRAADRSSLPFLLILTHAHPSSPPKPARTSRTSLELFPLLRPTSSEAWLLLRRGWGELRDVEGGLKAVSARTRKKGPALDEEVPFSGSEARRRWT
jgi:hypothetical protein